METRLPSDGLAISQTTPTPIASEEASSNVAATPLQFLPNDAEERYVRHYGKRQSLVSFPNRHDRVDFQGQRVASIDTEINWIIGLARFHFNDRRFGHDDRAVCQNVRANRGNHEDARLGLENRTAGGERIGRRTGWRRNDPAIGIEFSQRFTV